MSIIYALMVEIMTINHKYFNVKPKWTEKHKLKPEIVT